MGSQNSAAAQPVCLLDTENTHGCAGDNPVVSYLKHLDNEDFESTELLEKRDFNTDRFRQIGEEIVSKAVLHESVRDGKCFQVSL